jgi:hypothetical protein
MSNMFDDLLGANFSVAGINAVRRALVNTTNFFAQDNPGADRYDLRQFGLGVDLPPSLKFWWQAAPGIAATSRWTNSLGVLQTTERPIPVPASGFIITTMTWICTGNPLLTDNVTLTLQKNGADQALTLTIPAGTSFYTPLSIPPGGGVTYSAGDTIDLKIRQSGATAQANWYCQVLLGGQ